jgi:hypothetical protein
MSIQLNQKMNKRNILLLLVLAAFAWSCNANKTCPTYASADNQQMQKPAVN